METKEWTAACSASVKKYDAKLKLADAGKPLNVYDYLNWLNESDKSVMEYLPKRN